MNYVKFALSIIAMFAYLRNITSVLIRLAFKNLLKTSILAKIWFLLYFQKSVANSRKKLIPKRCGYHVLFIFSWLGQSLYPL